MNFNFDFPQKPKINKLNSKLPEEAQEQFNKEVEKVKNYLIDVENCVNHNQDALDLMIAESDMVSREAHLIEK